jgi:hypothetical protein
MSSIKVKYKRDKIKYLQLPKKNRNLPLLRLLVKLKICHLYSKKIITQKLSKMLNQKRGLQLLLKSKMIISAK